MLEHNLIDSSVVSHETPKQAANFLAISSWANTWSAFGVEMGHETWASCVEMAPKKTDKWVAQMGSQKK